MAVPSSGNCIFYLESRRVQTCFKVDNKPVVHGHASQKNAETLDADVQCLDLSEFLPYLDMHMTAGPVECQL
jgi:hypothetical protein